MRCYVCERVAMESRDSVRKGEVASNTFRDLAPCCHLDDCIFVNINALGSFMISSMNWGASSSSATGYLINVCFLLCEYITTFMCCQGVVVTTKKCGIIKDMGMQAAGMALRVFREVRGFGQEEASVKAGLNKNQAGRWERGEKRAPRLDTLSAYAKTLSAPTTLIVSLYEDESATPIKGLRAAVKYLMDQEGLSEPEIKQLSAWRAIYGDQAVLEALRPELD
jgi:transcriptional regulator with XRE-family HTH domain